MAAKKMAFKVIWFATSVNERDIEVTVKASRKEDALKAAAGKEPALAKHKDGI